MDQELKQYLQDMEARMEARGEGRLELMEGRLITRMDSMSANTFTLVTDMKDSLERQINLGFEDMAARFEVQAARLDRQAAMIQTGSRWTNRINDWADKVDIALDKIRQDIIELRRGQRP